MQTAGRSNAILARGYVTETTSGNFHSEKLHVVERYKFIDKDHLDYEATIEDPDVFTRPVEDGNAAVPSYRKEHPATRVRLLRLQEFVEDPATLI